ncbi:hypothetical protein G8764_07475 [Pseudomaricurvus alcaniphilus]|uniref:hypothetical protein n=1 Tax=Pseudomaricurvus alcaniphilus TaxID=1166482 RepID=UPI001407A6E3|nr:hypothetical protein [Pseudomaricurvus alcaniphilus]NHN37128.1 hypothetical protein [Pseudomaricurvus alcaniphilus]
MKKTRPSRVAVLGRMLSGLLLAAALLLPGWALAANRAPVKTYYRYINDQGVKVINHQIPPEYVQKGYEVVSAHGVVLKIVDPAPTEEEAEAAERERARIEAQREWDEELLRRYSSLRDIEAAKQRKLAQIQTSINILESNISNIKSQIVTQQAKAADSERLGREVPKQILAAISGLEEELRHTREQADERQQLYQETIEKYERDKQRFDIIRPETD